jgi:imidazoleglycerol-phosphate dehydratase
MKTSSYTIEKSTPTQVQLKRTTSESAIEVTIEGAWGAVPVTPRACTWNTGIKFLNHMIQLICRRASLNIDAEFKCVLDATFAAHVVWEDVGMVLGAGVAELLENRRQSGVEGAGVGVACIDEALSRSYLSFEGRSGFFARIAESRASQKELVEDAKCQDVRQFFDGFAQGSRASVHLELGVAEDSHHLWESAFRAFGEALRVALAPNEWRKGVSVGVKDARD